MEVQYTNSIRSIPVFRYLCTKLIYGGLKQPIEVFICGEEGKKIVENGTGEEVV